MLELVEVRTIQDTLLSLQLDDTSSGITVQDMDGLDPVKATIVSTDYAGKDGSQYQSARRGNRNITMKLGLEPPDYITSSVKQLRDQVYSFFTPKTQISLRLYDSEGLTVDIVGRVESCVSPLFVQEPTVDVSIICFDPDFLETGIPPAEGNSVSTEAEQILQYSGTEQTGFTFKLMVDRDIPSFTMYNRQPDNTIAQLEFNAPLLAGDVMTISTVTGAKGATVTRGGVDSSLLYGVTPESTWINLVPGNNFIRVYIPGAAIPYTIEYTNHYGGL